LAVLVAGADVEAERGAALAAMALVITSEIPVARPLPQVRGRPPWISRRLRRAFLSGGPVAGSGFVDDPELAFDVGL